MEAIVLRMMVEHIKECIKELVRNRQNKNLTENEKKFLEDKYGKEVMEFYYAN